MEVIVVYMFVSSGQHSVAFIHFFRFFDKIFLKFTVSVIALNKFRKIAELFDLSFLPDFMLNFSKFRLFSSKIDQKCFFSPFALNLLKVDTLKLQHYSAQDKKELVVLPLT